MRGYPLIFDLNGFALDDGPGLRTTVFFKGCPLSCVWCHNPESWSPELEIALYPEHCIDCRICVSVCPEGAISPGLRNKRIFEERIDRKLCSSCGACAVVCPAGAIKTVGKYYPPEVLLKKLLENRPFYDCTSGGVTFSGGEPTMHMPYLSSIMRRLKDEGVHTALQTSGMFGPEEFCADILPFADIIYFDLKIIDSERHKKYTGAGNELILRNFRLLASTAHDKIVPRTPLVAGITDADGNIEGITAFLKEAGYDSPILLPYNPGGVVKRKRLGISLPQNTS